MCNSEKVGISAGMNVEVSLSTEQLFDIMQQPHSSIQLGAKCTDTGLVNRDGTDHIVLYSYC